MSTDLTEHQKSAALIEKIRLFVQPLFVDNKAKRPELFGTAFLVNADGEYFLVTAAHVLKPMNDLYFIAEAPSFRNLSGATVLTTFRDLAAPGERDDLAVVRLSGDPLPPYAHWSGIPFSNLVPQPSNRPMDGYAFIGYPSSRAKVNPVAKTVRPRHNAVVGMQLAVDGCSRLGLNPATHLVFHFDRKKISSAIGDEFPVLNGLSGSPIWHFDGEIGTVVGVAIEYHANERLLVATDIRILLPLFPKASDLYSEIMNSHLDTTKTFIC